ncbi:MAG: ABC transporter substrate-binding protein, partial [Chloroflexota bacterium]
MRGFRWQLLALVMAAVVFGLSWLSQPEPPQPQPTADPVTVTPTEVTATPTPTQTPEGLLPTSTPMVIPQAPASAEDNVPTFSEALVGRVERLNPLLSTANPAEDAITSLIYEGLLRTNAYGEPVPALADSWVVGGDQIEYVFRLRQDVLWQDGVPFTARDVAFTTDLLRSPDFPGDPDVQAFWATVETQILGDYLIRFRLTQPLGGFLDALRVGILPEHALRGTGASDLTNHPFNLSPVGTGPYQLEAIRTSDGSAISVVDLRRAPVHIQRTGIDYGVERLRFQVYGDFNEALAVFSSGDVDGLAAPSNRERAQLIRSSMTPVHTRLEPTLGALIFNWRRLEEPEGSENEEIIVPDNPFREERVRQALALSLNRRAIVERNLLNRAVQASNPLMPGIWAYAADIVFPPADPVQAVALLEQANITPAVPGDEGGSGRTFLAFAIMTPDVPELVAIAEEIAGQWGPIDVTATVDVVDVE